MVYKSDQELAGTSFLFVLYRLCSELVFFLFLLPLFFFPSFSSSFHYLNIYLFIHSEFVKTRCCFPMTWRLEISPRTKYQTPNKMKNNQIVCVIKAWSLNIGEYDSYESNLLLSQFSVPQKQVP